jgi:hypothetical protein
VSCAEETNDVASVAPFHCTAELAMKLEPFRVKANAALPAVAFDGRSEVIAGLGF